MRLLDLIQASRFSLALPSVSELLHVSLDHADQGKIHFIQVLTYDKRHLQLTATLPVEGLKAWQGAIRLPLAANMCVHSKQSGVVQGVPSIVGR